MRTQDEHRGGVTVGHLEHLSAIEVAAIECLRSWFSSATTRSDMIEGFVTVLGADGGSQVASDLSQLFDIMTRCGRRPLMRHDCDCRCVGAHEAIFAQLIRSASEGDTEETALLSALIVHADQAQRVAITATAFAAALSQISAPKPRTRLRPQFQTSKTIH